MIRRVVLTLLAAGAVAAPLATAQVEDAVPDTAPEITGLKVSRSPFPRRKDGTTIRFTLSEAASVALTFEKLVDGRRKAVPGTVTFDLDAGKQALGFDGRVGSRELHDGRYRMTVVATDAEGAASDPARAEVVPLKPVIFKAVNSCIKSVESVPDLSDRTREDLKRICERAGFGSVKDIRGLSRRVCLRIVKDTVPAGKSRRAAKRACRKG